MERLFLAPALAALVWVSGVDASAQPLGVFVTATEAPLPAKPTEADRVQAWAEYDAANKARKDLEKTLKAQYGNKREKWPVEAQEQLADAEETRYRVNMSYAYRVDAEPVGPWRAGTAEAMTRSGNTGRKEHITPVSSPEQAHLILTITGVRNPSAVINAADDRCMSVRLERGPKVSAAQFASVPRTYRPKIPKATRLAGPRDDAPFWQFEGCGLYPYFDTDETVARLVNEFVGTHRAVLTASPPQ